MVSRERVYPPGKLPLQLHLFADADAEEKSRRAPRNSSSIAVPFKWEIEPGVPKQWRPAIDPADDGDDPRKEEEEEIALLVIKSSSPAIHPGERDRQQRGSGVTAVARAEFSSPSPQSPSPPLSSSLSSSATRVLAPPPRLMTISGATRNSLSSPRSPRSISLSRRMKSLLQGKKLGSLSSSSSPRKFVSPSSSSSSLLEQQASRLWDFEPEKMVLSSTPYAQQHEEEDDDERYSVSRCSSSNDIVFEGELLELRPEEKQRQRQQQQQQQQQQGWTPFKSMSNMLLERWYGGSSSVSSSGVVSFRDQFSIPASTSSCASNSSSGSIVSPPTSTSSSDLESPGSSTDNSLSSFSSDSSTHHQILHVPRHDHEFKTSFDSCDGGDDAVKFFAAPATASDDDDDDEGDVDFTAAGEFLAKKFYYQSDRFRVESSESPSLLRSRKSPVLSVVPPLPSALKSGKSSSKCLKKVRFACVEEEDGVREEPQQKLVEDDPEVREPEEEEEDDDDPAAALPSPVLSRFSSRPASRFYSEEDDGGSFYSSPRCSRRDASQLFLRIIEADAEASRKNKGAFKSMFRSRW